MSNAQIRTLLIALSWALYSVSLFLPALLFATRGPIEGYWVLLWGWWGLMGMSPAWLANVAFYAAGIACIARKDMFARWASGATLLLGLSSFAAKEWWFNEGSGTPIRALGSGFYLWMASFVLLLLASFIVLPEQRQVPPKE
jgi:hypothetical protein